MKNILITLAVLLITANQVQASDDWEIQLNVSPTSGTAPMSVSIQTIIVEAPVNTTRKDTTTAVVTVTSAGQVWMDRNLGASHVATSSHDVLAFGDMYQWGRGADGHQLRTSGTTTSQSPSEVPGHSNFIKGSRDWLSTRNDNLWQGVSGVNNPCPTGFRLPTRTEWETEISSWTSTGIEGAFASELRLVVGGNRGWGDGTIHDLGPTGDGDYWSSTADDNDNAYSLGFVDTRALTLTSGRANGYSIRCIQD